MVPRTITGKWDELVHRADLHGRMVQVTVLDEQPVKRTSKRSPEERRKWLESLDRLMKRGFSAEHEIDTSRDSIYTGTIDDTR